MSTALRAALWLMFLSPIQPTAQTPATTTSLVGCVSDQMGIRTPGATIVVKGDGLERTTVTDAAGCYRLNDLPSRPVRVTARLLGFDNVSQDRVALVPGVETHVDFTLHISPVCECVFMVPPQTLAAAWARADAVIYLRLSDADAGAFASPHYYRHIATVLEVLKRHAVGGPATEKTAVLEHQGTTERGAAPAPFAAGQEVVVFARWAPWGDAFLGLGTFCCGNYETAFLVQGGRIRQAPPNLPEYVGMRLDTFLDKLRAFKGRG